MATPDIFDEIIEYLHEFAENNPTTEINQELAQKFFTEQQPPKQSQVPPPVQTAGAPPEQYTRTVPPPPQQYAQPEPTQQPAPEMPKTVQLSDLAALNLDELNSMTQQCRLCPLHKRRNNVVFGAGNPNAELMFIGEGPGYHEDMQGIPFVGEAGDLLTKMIAAMQYTRQDVYIANIVKCRPPNNRNPHDDEAEACLPYLKRQIELIKPKVIVLLGAVPLKYLMERTGIIKNHGKWMKYNDIPVMPTFHPAYLLRYKEAKRDAWNDLQMVMKVLGKTLPGRK